MSSHLCSLMSGLSIASSSRSSPPACGGISRAWLTATECPPSWRASGRGTLVVTAAQNAKKRIRTAERSRQYNKARRSAVATRMKKYLKAVGEYQKIESEDELAPLQLLLNDAYEEIDKAIVKGIMKKNTGARRKSRLAHARQRVLIASGLYTPVTQ